MDKQKILHLTLKHKWFDLIERGEKKIEFREIKPYWVNRLIEFDSDIEFACYDEYIQLLIKGEDLVTDLNRLFGASYRHFDEIHFRNGYSKNAPFMRTEYIKTDITGQFNIHLGEILEIRNWDG